MRFQSVALLAGATTAIAAETVTLFLPGFDSQDINAKVLGSSGRTTTYLINCPGSSESEDCGIPANGITVVQGSSSVSLGYSFDKMTVAERCSYDSVSVTCSVSLDERGLTTTMNSAVALTEFPGAFMPVTVTATGTGGASATTGASASASTVASTTGATLTTSASTTGSTATDATTGTSAAGESSDSSSAAATSQTETGNAAMPMITGNARWAAGGVAAALALAAL
ncbi:hypothetical protein N7475_006559 [Penicillium sp. IBT 31633x]|nr:hypothetical protein N7475_006559 [Penicillium sp. IBT 31633x]